jgi:hypothetical protein
MSALVRSDSPAAASEPREVAYDPIPRRAAISVDEFRREFEKPARPVVLTGVLDRWPARRRWTHDYFAERHGDLDVVALQVKGARVDITRRQAGTYVTVRLGDVIARLRSGQSAGQYVSTPISQLPPELRADFAVPPYCAGARWRRPKLWLGGAGTVMPLHFDVPLNLYALITGAKRFLLYPPRQSRLLYPCGFFSQAPNFAQTDPEAPDPARHPRFAAARPLGCVLRGGEILYVPRGWWHHVRTLEDSIAIGFWYGGIGTAALSGASIAFRRLRGLSAGEWGAAKRAD